ncbi:DNA alkylation repair protein [Amycolatopsis sp. cg5]|uniref:DNA alkylation repair protein n=1 Tax=Amycolatopsis sp. cg5 TaxID=3238802 RepID=UPI003524256D
MQASRDLVDAVRTGLAERADPVKAPEMRAYMKSEMDFLGVQKPARRELTREIFRAHPLPDRESFTDSVLTLWRDAKYREERYVALDLTGDRAYAHWLDSESLELYDELIVTGAWWDYVDEIAVRRIGPILRAEPDVLKPRLRDWAADADRWRRRTAVICQIGSKEATDTSLLSKTIELNVADKDFFLRKGIVTTHPGLSGLSQREALKHL